MNTVKKKTNSWHRGDPVCMDSTTESPCKSQASFFFFLSTSVGNVSAMSRRLAQQCRSLWWKHRPERSCDPGGQRHRQNGSWICQMLRVITLHGLRGKWKCWALFGMWHADFKRMHFNTACRPSVSLNEVNGTTSKGVFPIDIIPSLHLTYLNKMRRNTWFFQSRSDNCDVPGRNETACGRPGQLIDNTHQRKPKRKHCTSRHRVLTLNPGGHRALLKRD